MNNPYFGSDSCHYRLKPNKHLPFLDDNTGKPTNIRFRHDFGGVPGVKLAIPRYWAIASPF